MSQHLSIIVVQQKIKAKMMNHPPLLLLLLRYCKILLILLIILIIIQKKKQLVEFEAACKTSKRAYTAAAVLLHRNTKTKTIHVLHSTTSII